MTLQSPRPINKIEPGVDLGYHVLPTAFSFLNYLVWMARVEKEKKSWLRILSWLGRIRQPSSRILCSHYENSAAACTPSIPNIPSCFLASSWPFLLFRSSWTPAKRLSMQVSFPLVRGARQVVASEQSPTMALEQMPCAIALLD